MEPLLHRNYYHIYNRGINSENLFIDKNNYEYFIGLFVKYIQPVCDIFAWCLMPNHFYFLVRLKEIEEINKKELPIPKVANSVRVCNPDRIEAEVKAPHLYFSHLFNAYTQAINKYSSRHGNLFERPFKRILVKDESYLKQLILYIHNNHVKHGFTTTPCDYTWSSYNEIISSMPTKHPRDKIFGLFNDRANFIFCHRNIQEPISIDDLSFD